MKYFKNWKSLFITIAIINIVVISLIISLIFIPRESVEKDLKLKSPEGVELSISSNKDDLTLLINDYLQKQSKGKSLDYRVELTNQVNLIGTIVAFNKEIDIVMAFEPVVDKYGNLILKQESISLGQLRLPVSYVLKYINDKYSLPTWVEIDPKEQIVYVKMTDMKLKSDVSVKVDKFDLENNQILLKLIVPLKNR
ncbi:YpmS family protein [Bacillus timonensis]|nr:YpmS family protein [Bacillus timonensis]